MKKLTLIIYALLTAASTAAAGSTTLQVAVPSPSMNVQSSTFQVGDLPSGACVPGTMRVGPDAIPRFCTESGTWGFLRGVFRQDSSTISLSDTTDTSYYFYLGPSSGTPDQGITIPKNGGIVAKGAWATDPVLTTSGAGTRMVWYPRKSAFRAGTVSGTQWDDVKMGEHSIALGYDNEAVGPWTAVLSGANNKAGRDDLGELTRLLLSSSVVAGGAANHSRGIKTFIGAGHGNIAEGSWSAVVGGVQNQATGGLSFIGGGGDQTEATWNTASGFASSIVGGKNNTASGNLSSIGGGEAHTASNDFSTISGGFTNTASGASTTVGGGSNNTASGVAATVGGGATNTASNQASTVAGGNLNQANGVNSSVLGGFQNIAGGQNATVIGGYNNQANGDTAIAGGSNLTVTGERSIALGHPGAATTVSQNDAIVLLPQGNVGIGITNPNYKLHVSGNAKITNTLYVLGNLGVGVPAHSSYSIHIGQAMKLEPLDSPPAAEDGVLFYHSSGAVCIYAGGDWQDLLNGKLGGTCY